MPNPYQHTTSLLAQCIKDEERTPNFSFPPRISESDLPVFRISVDITSQDEAQLDELDRILANAQSTPKQPPPIDLDICDIPSPSSTYGLFSADLWPIGFRVDEWTIVQKREALKLDPFLKRFDYANPVQQLAELEGQFRGSPLRLTIDPHQNVMPIPIFTHGTPLSYLDWDLRTHRYVIDHCAYHDDTTAYLRVHCFTAHRTTCSVFSDFPPYVLAIPKEFCNVRTHPILDNVVIATPTLTDENVENVEHSLPLPSCFSIEPEEKEESVGWKDWFRGFFCF